MQVKKPSREVAHGRDEQLFVHYYDIHPTKEDLMGESAAQSTLIHYLLSVLTCLFRAQSCFIVSNLNIYRHRRRYEYPMAPDIAVFKGISIPNPASREFRSWRLYEANRPPPHVVFEFSSEETWQADISKKPARYADLGVREYIAYDPNDPPYWPAEMGRLRVWRCTGDYIVECNADAQGRVWSDELECWLVPDGALLRLMLPDGRIAPTEAEAERAAREAALAKLRELGVEIPDRI
ncbi:MAG: Uma2 family endonuclease [Roseiflexus sp.]